MFEFLSDAWFGRVRELAASEDLQLRADANARLQYTVGGDAGPIRWIQVIEDGRLVAWERGEIADPDVEIRWSPEVALDVWRGAMSGTAASAATTIAEQRSTGPYVGPPPPMDFGRQAEFHDLPRLPGVDLTHQISVLGGPFGDVVCVITYVDGQGRGMTLGSIPQPDVALEVGFRDLILMRGGELTALDLVARGQISGFEGSLGALAGIAESPAHRRAQSLCASGPGSLALATLGEFVSQDAYQERLADLWAVTSFSSTEP